MTTPIGAPEIADTDGGAPPRRRGPHTDVLVAAAIVAFCLAVLAFTTTFEEIPASLAQGMQAAAFPRLVVAVIIVLTGVMVFLSRTRPDPVREKLPAIFYRTIGMVLAFMVVLYVAGMMVATPFAIVSIGRLWGERRWWLMAVIGVLLALCLRVLFVNVFGVQLPNGLIVDRWR